MGTPVRITSRVAYSSDRLDCCSLGLDQIPDPRGGTAVGTAECRTAILTGSESHRAAQTGIGAGSLCKRGRAFALANGLRLYVPSSVAGAVLWGDPVA